MQRRDLRDAAGEAGVWRVAQPVLLDHRADAHPRGEAADPRDVRLYDVDELAAEDLAEADRAELRLAARERYPRGATDLYSAIFSQTLMAVAAS